MLKKSLVGASVAFVRNEKIEQLGIIFIPGVEYRKCAKVYRVIIGNAASQGLCLLFTINGAPG